MQHRMRPKRILVVEDEAIVAADLQERLRALGYDPVGVVAAGEDALPKAREIGAELVLMDIQLQGAIDGVEAADAIREALDIPVVFLTAHVDQATFQRAKLSAPFGFVRKPFEGRELHTALEIAFYRHATEAELKKTQRWLQAVLGCIDVALVVTDRWGLIELMNSAAGTLSGWAPADAMLKPMGEVFRLSDTETRSPVQLPLGESFDLQSAIQSRSPVILQTASPAEMLLNYSGSAIRDEHGRVAGVVWLFTSRPFGL